MKTIHCIVLIMFFWSTVSYALADKQHILCLLKSDAILPRVLKFANGSFTSLTNTQNNYNLNNINILTIPNSISIDSNCQYILKKRATIKNHLIAYLTKRINNLGVSIQETTDGPWMRIVLKVIAKDKFYYIFWRLYLHRNYKLPKTSGYSVIDATIWQTSGIEVRMKTDGDFFTKQVMFKDLLDRFTTAWQGVNTK